MAQGEILMGKKPLISIITPVYNVERYLKQCVDSVVAQTFKDWELILVDDGSTDGSGAIIDKYASMDERIKVIHKKNTGQADSRNIALKVAEADLVGFVDSDDWIEPDMYEVLYQTMQETGSDISVCGYYTSYVNGEKSSCPDDGDVKVYRSDEALKLLLRDRYLKNYLWDKLYKRHVITSDMPKSYFYEDYATLVKWFASCDTVSVCSRPRYHYRQRMSSTDHEVIPSRKYHFFLAERERCEYVRSRGNLPDSDEELDLRIVRAGISQAKEMTVCKDAQSAFHYMDAIRTALEDYPDIGCRQLGLKGWIRLCLLRRSLKWFRCAMRASRVFVLWKIGKKRNSYV